MPFSEDFPISDAAWQERLATLQPARYAKTRNHLNGAVSRLSPYITHGYLSLREAVEGVRARHPLGRDDKLFAEFAWRAFFHHVWAHEGSRIFSDLRPAIAGVRYAAQMPDDVIEGRTGLAVIDQAVASLYQTGYLHNHARMWLASYLVHLRHVHWRVGADWLYGHLLDGDLAANHLSWQWVAGTFSTKPYLFNAENVARYAPALWQSAGSPLDTSYEHLEMMARGEDEAGRHRFEALAAVPSRVAFAVEVPGLYAQPPEALSEGIYTDVQRLMAAMGGSAPREGAQNIDLVHAWSLVSQSRVWRSDPDGPCLRLGVVHLPGRAVFPWSARRWAFVLERLRAICDFVFVGDAAALLRALGGLPQGVKTACYGQPGCPETAQVFRAVGVLQKEPPGFLTEPSRPCRSFSQFIRAVDEC